jgi:hypothetical protein
MTMRTLHRLLDSTEGIFFPELPCPNPYHSGYENERSTANSHYTCIQSTLDQRANGMYPEVWMCECGSCREIQDQHYFVKQDGYELHGEEDVVTCHGCLDGAHPRRP